MTMLTSLLERLSCHWIDERLCSRFLRNYMSRDAVLHTRIANRVLSWTRASSGFAYR